MEEMHLQTLTPAGLYAGISSDRGGRGPVCHCKTEQNRTPLSTSDVGSE